MGKVLSTFVRRPLRNFNVENRAFRELEREKPKAAPRHESSKAGIQRLTENQDSFTAQKEKNESLLGMLDGMIAEPQKVPEIKSRPLPQNREQYEDPEFGYLEPVRIPRGKCSIREALGFITSHGETPEQHSSARIAEERRMDPHVVEYILKHFHTLQMQVPFDSRGNIMTDFWEANSDRKVQDGSTAKPTLEEGAMSKPELDGSPGKQTP